MLYARSNTTLRQDIVKLKDQLLSSAENYENLKKLANLAKGLKSTIEEKGLDSRWVDLFYNAVKS